MKPSRIVNCDIIPRHEDDGKVLFDFSSGDGSLARVDLEGYLICPKDMFDPGGYEAAIERYTRTRR